MLIIKALVFTEREFQLAACVASTLRNRITLQWRHNGHNSVSNHQPYDFLLNCLFRRIWKKTSKLRVIGLCVGNSLLTGEFPAQMASNAGNVFIWWRHHGYQNLNFGSRDELTHWIRLTHICVSKVIVIGLDNGLSPGRPQAIIWTNDWMLLIRTLASV